MESSAVKQFKNLHDGLQNSQSQFKHTHILRRNKPWTNPKLCDDKPAPPAHTRLRPITSKYCMRYGNRCCLRCHSLSCLIPPGYCREFSRLMIKSTDRHANASLRGSSRASEVRRDVEGRKRQEEEEGEQRMKEEWRTPRSGSSAFVILPDRKQETYRLKTETDTQAHAYLQKYPRMDKREIFQHVPQSLLKEPGGRQIISAVIRPIWRIMTCVCVCVSAACLCVCLCVCVSLKAV